MYTGMGKETRSRKSLPEDATGSTFLITDNFSFFSFFGPRSACAEIK
jgi:hypothetical protein